MTEVDEPNALTNAFVLNFIVLLAKKNSRSRASTLLLVVDISECHKRLYDRI